MRTRATHIVVWTSLEAVLDAVGQDYVIVWRQKASDVVFPDDVETIRNDLEQGCNRDGTQVCLKTCLLTRAASARGDTSFYSILYCNDMESVATSPLN